MRCDLICEFCRVEKSKKIIICVKEILISFLRDDIIKQNGVVWNIPFMITKREGEKHVIIS